ncbi:hypothetical protein MC885_005237 [Smutsia gigantea]|nr:hypothetical protein MC885_005237 [Smutsia gigantea]
MISASSLQASLPTSSLWSCGPIVAGSTMQGPSGLHITRLSCSYINMSALGPQKWKIKIRTHSKSLAESGFPTSLTSTISAWK